MSKNKLKVDAKVSTSVGKVSNILRVLGWISLVVFVIILFSDVEWVVGLSGVISSLAVIFSGIVVRGLAVITKSAEIHIATTNENYDIEEVTDSKDESE